MDDHANFSEEKVEGNFFYASYSNKQENTDFWQIDSGCSNHMSGNKKIFFIWILLLLKKCI